MLNLNRILKARKRVRAEKKKERAYPKEGDIIILAGVSIVTPVKDYKTICQKFLDLKVVLNESCTRRVGIPDSLNISGLKNVAEWQPFIFRVKILKLHTINIYKIKRSLKTFFGIEKRFLEDLVMIDVEIMENQKIDS